MSQSICAPCVNCDVKPGLAEPLKNTSKLSEIFSILWRSNTTAYKDITERLEVAAEEAMKRDKSYGMSTARMLLESRDEILRLRDELMIEMRNTALQLRHAANKQNPPTYRFA